MKKGKIRQKTYSPINFLTSQLVFSIVPWESIRVQHLSNHHERYIPYSGYVDTIPDFFEIAYFFYTDRPYVHTKPINPVTETALFSNRSPEKV